MEQDCQGIDSLYDYIYLDKDRISSLTSQLFSAGVLTAVRQVSGEGESSKLGAKVSVKILGGNAETTENYTQSQERAFDASWSIPLNLLDKLSERGIIKKGLTTARLGDLVQISGTMKLFDAHMVHQVMPAIKKFVTVANGHKKPSKQEVAQFTAVEEMMKFLPKSTQIDVADTDENLIWMSVDPQNLTISSGDIALKYGSIIPGEWHVIGFVDAHPHGYIENPNAPYPCTDNELKNSMDFMIDMIREVMGRPNSSFGITPLMIFRSVR